MKVSSREVVEGFMAALQSEGPRAAAERYVSPDYIQRHPDVPPGREAAIAYLEDELRRGGRASLKAMVVEGDRVVLHLHMQFDDGSPDLAIMEMMRIENGRIAEHWYVGQPVPETTASGNSMF